MLELMCIRPEDLGSGMQLRSVTKLPYRRVLQRMVGVEYDICIYGPDKGFINTTIGG